MKVLLAALLLLGGLVYAGENCIDPKAADVNQDGYVTMTDVVKVVDAFGTFKGHPRYNAVCDINQDGKIDMGDIAWVAECFGYSY
jgi:hypothetical protein